MLSLDIDAYWYWWSFAIMLVIMQLFVEDVFFLSMAAAAALMGLVIMFLPDLSFSMPVQVLVFSGLSLITIILARNYMRSETSDRPFLNQRGQEYVGRVVILDEPIVNGSGNLTLDGMSWKLIGLDCAAGSHVRIVGLEGIALRVESA